MPATQTDLTAVPTLLPSGAPVRACGSMGDMNHTPSIIAERIEHFRIYFPVGTVVKRNDRAVILINQLSPPTCGGYVTAYGQIFDIETGAATGGWCSWRADLAECTVIRPTTTCSPECHPSREAADLPFVD